MLDMTEYQTLYMEELDEQLQLMEEEVLRFEQDGETMEGIQRLFRAAHTLKGSSAAMGYERMKRLTHNMEHILEKVRNRECTVTPDMATLFLCCLDRMKQLRSEIASGHTEVSDIEDLVEDLKKVNVIHSALDAAILNTKISADIQLSEEIGLASIRLLESGQYAFWVRIQLTDHCEMRAARFHVLQTLISETSVVLWSEAASLSEAGKDSDQSSLRWLIVSREPQDMLEASILAWVDVEQVQMKQVNVAELEALTVTSVSDLSETKKDQLGMTSVMVNPERTRVQSIRVNVDRLEQLMNLVGELVIDQTRIKQIEKSMDTKFGKDELVQDLGQMSDHFSRIIGELQESVMKVRMLPIEQLFNRFPRLIRDLSQSLGKEIELILEGKETELDRTLIEEIGDPLIHILRNSVDHGIEASAIRRERGKPAKGRILLRASHEDNQVLIVVKDDGGGIDSGKLLQKAISTNLITAAEAEQFSDKEAIDLIFHPGLSTASQVSDISGRGVGMDIVRAGIEKINGRLDIETVKGQGTEFKIRLPLTLAIITGLLVTVNESTYIIPMSNVAEIVRLSLEEIQNIRSVPMVTIRDQVIPIVWLHDCLGYPKRIRQGMRIPVVIIGRAEKRYALAVDELLGNQEIVIKSLGDFVGQIEGIAGATILGNGKVALILEIGGLIRMMSRA
ncbi:chemotaxis protein CheA [Cohnella herbarum]|uniref:Chemotaxis protein CheA n=1 Tax=Cohnella herbarum TaxID=2728023 RepID=A0A7Z2ZM87_9BACL|nr:chemotaxis protein CheA [Cohnella herbarum]QJD84803.1 chemotaxis protein CheA [Cohnella herbarum]